jgi:hypothetical protein
MCRPDIVAAKCYLWPSCTLVAVAFQTPVTESGRIVINSSNFATPHGRQRYDLKTVHSGLLPLYQEQLLSITGPSACKRP